MPDSVAPGKRPGPAHLLAHVSFCLARRHPAPFSKFREKLSGPGPCAPPEVCRRAGSSSLRWEGSTATLSWPCRVVCEPAQPWGRGLRPHSPGFLGFHRLLWEVGTSVTSGGDAVPTEWKAGSLGAGPARRCQLSRCCYTHVCGSRPS